MKAPYAVALGIFLAGVFVSVLVYLTHGHAFPLLFPSGSIGVGERDVMVRTLLMMLIVVVPVFILIIFMAVHYRAGNTKAAYTPDWENSPMEELVWWSIPFEIVLVLSAITWGATHQLDPARPIESSQPPLVVDVVALPWKWLFIYPEEGVASVDEVALPVGRPVEFHITANAPMNSFWIPALGGQEYAMTGMDTVLHLVADAPGNYPGLSANYSGEGFAGMTFTAKGVSEADYAAWIAHAKASGQPLTPEAYESLAKPSDEHQIEYFDSLGVAYHDILMESMGMNSTASMSADMDMHMQMSSTTP